MSPIAATMLALFYLMAPVKEYNKPGDRVEVRFAQIQNAQAAKVVAVVGLKAIDLPGGFTPVAIADENDAKDLHLYTLEGKEIGRTVNLGIKPGSEPAGTVDIAAYFPEIQKVGTYILTYKTAQPLLINTLPNAGFSKRELATMSPADLANLPPASKERLLAQFAPVTIQITPLVAAVISTDQGDIKATFAYDVAPHTVANFIDLASGGFYDDGRFHRIIKGFMIQGGDTLGTSTDRAGTGGPGYNVAQEFSDKSHVRGVLSMARSSEPNSAGSQFFIMLADKTHLNGQYTAFGQVIEGMDVVDKIGETKVTDENGSTKVGDRPVIKSIRIIPATAEMYGIKAK